MTDRAVVEGVNSGRLEDDWCMVEEAKWTGGVAAATESTIEADGGGNVDWRRDGADEVIEEVANLADSCWKHR